MRRFDVQRYFQLLPWGNTLVVQQAPAQISLALGSHSRCSHTACSKKNARQNYLAAHVIPRPPAREAQFIAICYIQPMPMKLISNKVLREFALLHPDAGQPLQDFRYLMEKGTFGNFAQLKATFASVDKVGDRFVFNIGGNKYRLVAAIAFQAGLVWVKAVLLHKDYDKGDWK